MKDKVTKFNFIFLLRSILILLFIVILCSRCTPKVQSKHNEVFEVNTSHLDALYEEKKVNGHHVGIVHIYSEYPDYHWVGDEDEGIACVDDASRAAVFYVRQYKLTSSPDHLYKSKMLFRFLLEMQSPNGYFYNFIWPDGNINKNGKTSEAIPTWWSWRSLWALGEAVKILDTKDHFVDTLRQHRDVLMNSILQEDTFFSTKTDTAGGITIPTWLPGGSATDQASIMIMGLSLAYQQGHFDEHPRRRDSVALLINRLAEGIMMMQIRAPGKFCDGAFLSWENLWHAYASLPSYALLSAGQILGDPHMQAHALFEIDAFYPDVYAHGFMESFWVHGVNGTITPYNVNNLPQIAYGIRPMVYACMKAYEVTRENKYKEQALLLASWFSGQNPAKVVMYDQLSGRGFDGINDTDQINRNSGAESTIEALLTMQVIGELKK